MSVHTMPDPMCRSEERHCRWFCYLMAQTEAVGNSSSMATEETHWLIIVWGDGIIQAPRPCTTTSNYITSSTTHYTGRGLRSYIVATTTDGVNNETQFKIRYIPVGLFFFFSRTVRPEIIFCQLKGDKKVQ